MNKTKSVTLQKQSLEILSIGTKPGTVKLHENWLVMRFLVVQGCVRMKPREDYTMTM